LVSENKALQWLSQNKNNISSCSRTSVDHFRAFIVGLSQCSSRITTFADISHSTHNFLSYKNQLAQLANLVLNWL
jgi:hypothetical protein